MKKTKKVIAYLLVFTMALTMNMSVFATTGIQEEIVEETTVIEPQQQSLDEDIASGK